MFSYCGSSVPAAHISTTNVVSIHYVTNSNNTGTSDVYHSVDMWSVDTVFTAGTGWRALFQITAEITESGSVPTGGLVPSL